MGLTCGTGFGISGIEEQPDFTFVILENVGGGCCYCFNFIASFTTIFI